MREHDVLVLPTLFEGFSLVLLEAMSQGLVVVSTANSGGGEIIEDGCNGFIVPIRDVDALVEPLAILAGDRERLQDMGNAALATARRCSWEAYRHRLIDLVLHQAPSRP
jgi:glycosyltransferase involved in cell wall biosynthesis